MKSAPSAIRASTKTWAVDVGVDESGEQRLSRSVDDLSARRRFETRSDLNDPAVLDKDGSRGNDRLAVENARVLDEQDSAAGLGEDEGGDESGEGQGREDPLEDHGSCHHRVLLQILKYYTRFAPRGPKKTA